MSSYLKTLVATADRAPDSHGGPKDLARPRAGCTIVEAMITVVFKRLQKEAHQKRNGSYLTIRKNLPDSAQSNVMTKL